MLVIIVLLVIIVFFTSSVSKSGDTINKNSGDLCTSSNPVISSLGYIHAEYSTNSNDPSKCADSRFNVISIIPKTGVESNICGKTIPKGAVYCGTKIKNSWTCDN